MELSVLEQPAAARRERRAVIDIGTNSVKLLVGDTDGSAVERVYEQGLQTRLGEGLFETRQLRPEAITRTVQAASDFRATAARLGASRIFGLATAAAREASNGETLLAALRTDAGLDVTVISGDREATLAFRGVCSNPTFAHAALLVTDVGGGSTEFIVGDAGLRRFTESFFLGAVRLFEELNVPDDPSPSDLQRCRQRIDEILAERIVPRVRPALAKFLGGPRPFTYVAVGGTALILAAIVHGPEIPERHLIEERPLERGSLTKLVQRLWSLPLKDRRQLPGLPPERADIMLTGAAIHERILLAFDLMEMRPSSRGVRFGALLDPA